MAGAQDYIHVCKGPREEKAPLNQCLTYHIIENYLILWPRKVANLISDSEPLTVIDCGLVKSEAACAQAPRRSP